MIRLRAFIPLPTASPKLIAKLGVLVVALFMLSGCSHQNQPVRIHQVGDPLASNRVTVSASFLPGEPFMQSWTVTHQVPFIQPVALGDVMRIDFELGSRSPWLVRFNNWSGAHSAEPPATLTVTAARWNLTARTAREGTLEASAALEPGIQLLLAGPCDDMGCPYEFASSARANDWLSFSLGSADFPDLHNGWLRARDEVKITVSLAVWLSQGVAHQPSAADADYLSVTFSLASQGTHVLVASRR